jgi:hypothetical protein
MISMSGANNCFGNQGKIRRVRHMLARRYCKANKGSPL